MAHSPNGTGERISRAETIRNAARKQNEEFPLPHSGGGTALVRRLTLQDLVAMDAIPTASQQAVSKMLESMLEGTDGTADGMNLDAIMKALGGPIAGLKLVTELANASVIIGFIDPEVVANAKMITTPDRQVSLDQIDSRDRMAFWEWCQGQEEAEAKSFATLFQPRQTESAETPGHDADSVPVLQTLGSFEDERS